MTQQVCHRGKYQPMASPFGGGGYVLTLYCGHLWSWNVRDQGEFPKEVDCIHCDREERIRAGLEDPGPFASADALTDAVHKMCADQIRKDEGIQ